MCGPFVLTGDKGELHRFLLFRLIGYTLAGALMGGAGSWLKHSLEFQVLNAFAFLGFSTVTLVFVLPQLLPRMSRVSVHGYLAPHFQNPRLRAIRGFLLALMPCHLLAFYYGIAALTTSPLWGGALLFSHAVMTTPALAYAVHFSRRLFRVPAIFRTGIRVVLVGLVIFNLLFFAGRIFYPNEESKHILFCL